MCDLTRHFLHYIQHIRVFCVIGLDMATEKLPFLSVVFFMGKLHKTTGSTDLTF